LCAVLLRRLFFSYFKAIIQNTPPDVLEQIKNQIILLIRSPCDPNLKKKICDSAAELAKRLIGECFQLIYYYYLISLYFYSQTIVATIVGLSFLI
jgi:PREDICTED: similar to ran_GTP binding protein 5